MAKRKKNDVVDTHLKVTKKDLDDGIECSTSDCPLANMIKRKVQKKISVRVFKTQIWIMGMNARKEFIDYTYKLPKSVRDFISAYDDSKDEYEYEDELFTEFVIPIPKAALK